MSDPIVDPTDLGTYLNDATIDVNRAALLIGLAQAKCELIVSPLPAAASGVVLDVAARAYTTIVSSRQQQLNAAGSQFGSGAAGVGGVWLTKQNELDLRRMSGSGGAFSIDTLPADYVSPVLPYTTFGDWDQVP